MDLNDVFATRAELRATVEPMQNDNTEIKGDVKTLLLARAGDVAVEARVKDWGARKMSLAMLVIYIISATTALAAFFTTH